MHPFTRLTSMRSLGRQMQTVTLIFVGCVACLGPTPRGWSQTPWRRHAIDDQFKGADGVRLADFNGDGLQDVVTGWEESGLVRLYLHPGADAVTDRWPAVTVGRAPSPEDAVACDIDGDGKLDVLSCHEGKHRQAIVHWNDAPDNSTEQLLRREHWNSDQFPQLDGIQWMFALPLGEIDSRRCIAIGSKGKDASITLLVAPSDVADETPQAKRDLNRWTAIRLRPVGWIMSLRARDMDDDGDLDIVFSDRKGPARRVGWLEQPSDLQTAWTEHGVGGDGAEVMFLDIDQDRVVVATRKSHILDCRRVGAPNDSRWRVSSIENPPGVPFGKAVALLPEGRMLMTANTNASPIRDQPGIWIRSPGGEWSVVDPTTETKFDRMEVIDLDGDGDLDVMTCEERRNLGVIWYENPGQDSGNH
ncbi:VCBS repeat-containing protein [Roseiconus nitratireducens]|uniref:VCBS repeat-containing protein n=1 Tax=Roseiconus nitratireducens TaxID=2605748 RepID=A0A5M6DGR6_9BACT|nr:VCBS repeat-containing protein [Roseiconus nitratireducens]KAA5544425.1 VCBS repeat-containing protein [Roseiconus nitratireducens]